MAKLPAKASQNVDMAIKASLRSLETAKADADPISASNGVIGFLLTAVAETLFSEEQQQQVQELISTWKDCRYGEHRSATPVENVLPSVMSARRAM